MRYLVILNDAPYGSERSCCRGTCLKARGIADDRLTPGAHHSSLEELTDWTRWASHVVAF